MTTTADLDKTTLQKMNNITQAVLEKKLTNVQAADLLRKLREELAEKRREAHARTSQL